MEQQQDNQIATGHPRLRPSGFTPNEGRHMSSRSGRRPRFGGDGSTAPPKVPQNEILSKLPSEEFARLQEHASEAQFSLRDELFEPGDTLERVYFPLNVMFSLINVLEDGTAVEVMTVGREGFVGFTLLNEVSTARYKGMCQIAGTSLTMEAKKFLVLIEKMPDLRRRLRRYGQFANEVAAQSVARAGTSSSVSRAEWAEWALSSQCHATDLSTTTYAIRPCADPPGIGLGAQKMGRVDRVEVSQAQVLVWKPLAQAVHSAHEWH